MYCPKCGCEYQEGYTVCADCQVNLVEGEPEASKVKSIYAGGFARYIAGAIDLTLISSVALRLDKFFSHRFTEFFASFDDNVFSIASIIYLLVLYPGIFLLYYSVLESSAMKGTLGKRLFGLSVVDYNGETISFGAAIKRTISKITPFSFFFISKSNKKQAFHDSIGKTLVVKTRIYNDFVKTSGKTLRDMEAMD